MENLLLTIVSVAPVRQSPSHRSEMVTQLLFGEICSPQERVGDFVKVACRYDGYVGYVQYSQLAEIETGLFDISLLVSIPNLAVVNVNDAPLTLSMGSELYCRAIGPNQINREGLIAGNNRIVYSAESLDQLSAEPEEPNAARVITHAKEYLGTPYLWGGKSIWGIDCSGLVQMAFKQAGVFVPRDAWQQAEGGDVVGFLQEAMPGDLAFFDNEEGKITHVGILLNSTEILHASAMVRIDDIDHAGIVHRQSGKTNSLVGVLSKDFFDSVNQCLIPFQ